MLSMSNAETLIHAFMTSRLDYCNALLGGCSERLINKKTVLFLHYTYICTVLFYLTGLHSICHVPYATLSISFLFLFFYNVLICISV